MKPPSGGPTIGPTSAGIVTHDSACTISDFGIVRSSTSRPTGTIIAPPVPCTNRPATSAPSESLSAQPTEPTQEHGDRRHERRARAEAVGDPAADGNEHREREQIRRQRELQRDRVRREIRRDRRQRRREHRRVHVLDEQRASDDQRQETRGFHGEECESAARSTAAAGRQTQRGSSAALGVFLDVVALVLALRVILLALDLARRRAARRRRCACGCDPVLTPADVENNRSGAASPHFGHAGVSPRRTSSSKRWPQARHLKS